MDEPARSTLAASQLDRILGFIPRVETKASFLFAVHTAMLALLATNLKVEDLKIWWIAVPALFSLIAISFGLWCLYHCTFPRLDGGANSMIYFQEIAKRPEVNFVQEFTRLDHEEFTREILSQVWRNSEIVSQKFRWVRSAYHWTLIAMLPWFVFLCMASISHGQLPIK